MTTNGNSDWPYHFYFNGHEMPEWAARWHLCGLEVFLNGYQDDWDEFVGYRHIWQLETRLDHVGVIESEDPLIFRVCAQAVLKALLTNHRAVVERIRQALPEASWGEDVFEGLVEGIARMIALTHRDRIAVWTSGDGEDFERLKAMVSRFPVSRNEPLEELPHIRQRRAELLLRCELQLKDLRSLAQSGVLDKQLRRIVHQLPNVAGSGPGE